jgi:serine/threonine-protein kinase
LEKARLGAYVIEKRLATGGMAEVFVANRQGAHGFVKRVALKCILPQYLKDPDFTTMFINEARLAAHLEHPNIVQVFDFGEQDHELFLAMELVVGSNVNRLLRAVSNREEAVPLDVALHIASQTARALAYAHRARDAEGEPLAMVHRDVSPANILLTDTGHVKLSDFGIARVDNRSSRTDDGHVRGKLGYMSPEQVMGRPLDGRSDVFTLATVFAEMLLAEPLFGVGQDLDILLRIRDVDLKAISRSDRRIPQDVMKLLKLGLEADAQRRPSSSVFADAVDNVMRRRGIVRGPERLAKLLHRLELVKGAVIDERPSAPGGRPTNLFDTTGINVGLGSMEVGAETPSIYRVRKVDGRLFGPVSFPQLVQMVTTGLVAASTQVSREGSDFVPAHSIDELRRFVTSPALSWRAEEVTEATRVGDLGSGRLLPFVHDIATGRVTGVLHLFDDSRRKKIYFNEGHPEFVSSTDKNELLGEFLVSTGACLRMEVEMALALLPRYHGRLGDALVGLGILRPVELFRAISAQVKSRYLEAFRWRTGRFAFVPDIRCEEEVFPLGHDSRELMRDAAFEAHPEELEAALSPIREKVLVRIERPLVPLSAYRPPEHWYRLLNVAGDSTFSAILAREASQHGADAEEVYRAFYLGISCDLVTTAA